METHIDSVQNTEHVANPAKVENIKSAETIACSAHNLISSLEKEIERLNKIILFDDNPLFLRVGINERDIRTCEDRIKELEKHETHARLEATKAAWHLMITLIIAVSGWLIAIITKVSTSNFFEKVSKMFE